MLSADPVNSRDTAAARGDSRWWREVELWLLVLLALGIYFSRLTDLTIRGEESRWARVAHEMIESGDWIVPRQQGHPFPDRPPLNSWSMILASKLSGHLDLATIRLPTVIATLLTTLVIYLYGRRFLSRVGSFAAAAAFCTMAQVLQLGRVAESDSILVLCFTGALLGWHYGYACRGSAAWAWLIGYALAALAGLAKGPQGPIYFVAITTVFLCVRRDWRFLFNRWNLAGFGLFVLIVGAWQLPFFLALDSAQVGAVWSEGGEVGQRFLYPSLSRALRQWTSYPFETFACMLPWSFLLPVIATRWFRENAGSARPMMIFLLTCCAVAFPTCWLPADTRPRYFMSLYPCLALLVGLVIERSWQSRQVGWWQRSWDNYLITAVPLILGAGVFVAIARVAGSAKFYGLGQALSVPFVLGYALCAILAAAGVVWSRRARDLAHARVAVFCVAGFMGLSYLGIVMTLQARAANDPSRAVIAVREMIPPGERLVSFGPVHHLFAYYYEQPIELQKLIRRAAPADTTATYFCFVEDPKYKRPSIPFAWEPITQISCERSRSDNPLTRVVIGKRIVPNDNSPQEDDETSGWPFASKAEATLESFE